MLYYFLDFDGTLIDVSEKYYRTYCDILQLHHCKVIDKYLYWELKRSKKSEKEIHAITEAIIPDFAVTRRNIIETDGYQQFDKLLPGVKDFLKSLKSGSKIILVTLRHSHNQVLKQLETFGIQDYFDEVLSSGEETDPKWQIKQRLINRYFNQNAFTEGVFIGDTETDILAGKSFNFKTIAVLSGMRNYDFLMKVKPDSIVPSIDSIIL